MIKHPNIINPVTYNPAVNVSGFSTVFFIFFIYLFPLFYVLYWKILPITFVVVYYISDHGNPHFVLSELILIHW